MNISKIYMKDETYYNKLWKLIKEDQLAEKFYNHLLSVDLTNFNAYQFPKDLDDGGLHTKIQSLGAYGSFWWSLMFEECECIIGSHGINKREVYDMFIEFCSKSKAFERGISDVKFWMWSKKHIPVLNKKEQRFKKVRYINVHAHELAESFCKEMRLEMPKDFDELELLKEGEE